MARETTTAFLANVYPTLVAGAKRTIVKPGDTVPIAGVGRTDVVTHQGSPAVDGSSEILSRAGGYQSGRKRMVVRKGGACTRRD